MDISDSGEVKTPPEAECTVGPPSCTIMTTGCSVVLQKGDYMKAGKVHEKNSTKMGKDVVLLGGLCGHPFGSYFQLIPAESSTKGRTFALKKLDSMPTNEIENLNNSECGEDNRFIVDDSMSQNLKQDDIESLRDKGLFGSALVEQLVDNSKTFKQKTEYSQQKWLRQKKEKHLDYVVALKPSVRLLATLYYSQGPHNIFNFRHDTLAQMLCQCDVSSGGSYGLFETGTHGLLAAGILDRLRGRGQLLWLFDGELQKQAVNGMNFNSKEMECMLSLNIHQLSHVLVKKDSEAKPTEKSQDNNAVERLAEEGTQDGSKVNNKKVTDETLPEAEETLPKPEEKTNCDSKRLKRKFDSLEEVVKGEHILREGLDGVLLACKQHPLNILKTLVPFLRLSRPFAVFCPYQEPLIECYGWLKTRGGAVNVRLSESWLRTYQVLPDRTHPHISMSGGGGYLLTGTMVET